MLATGGHAFFFGSYDVSLDAVGRVLGGVFFFYVLWGFIWYGIKSLLLTYFVRFSKDERRQAFSSRMKAPFDVFDLLQRHSERRIRIADMIGRRGRFIVLGMAGFYYTYVQVANEPSANFATIALQDNLFDAVLTSWIFLAFYYSDGRLAAAFYGPQSRIMDGVLARANCLLITTLWTCFKFVMVPIGAQLTRRLLPRRVRDRLRADLGLLHRHRRARGDWRVAVRQAASPRLGHRRRQPQVDRRDGIGLRRRAGVLPHHGPRAARPLDRSGTRAGRVEHALRAVLASRHRRFHDGHVECADLLGLRNAGPVVRGPLGRGPLDRGRSR